MSRDGENEVRTTNILVLLLDHGAEVADKHSSTSLYKGGEC